MTQAFQLSQFINMTRRNCDVIILGGDLNVEPTDLEYRIITTNSGLRDAWTSQVCSFISNHIGSHLQRVKRSKTCKRNYSLSRANQTHHNRHWGIQDFSIGGGGGGVTAAKPKDVSKITCYSTKFVPKTVYK